MSQRAASIRIDPMLLQQRLGSSAFMLELYRRWVARSTWSQPPHRTDLTELETAPFQANLGWVCVLHASGEFRYRRLGSALQRLCGHDVTAALVGSEADPSPFGRLDRSLFAEGTFHERVIFSRRRVRRWEGRPLRLDCLVLPLRGNDAAIDSLLFAQEAAWWEDAPPGDETVSSPPLADDTAQFSQVEDVLEVGRYSLSISDSMKYCKM